MYIKNSEVTEDATFFYTTNKDDFIIQCDDT